MKPYIILNREGVKIAVLGMLTPAIPNWLTENLWSGLKFENMVTCARKWMKHIQETEKPDVVIGVFHSGKDGGIVTPEYEEDASLRVAKEVPGFDMVLFGHDHTRCNETITNVEGKPVVCLDPANNALNVADAEVTLTLNKKKVNGKKQYVVTDKKVTGSARCDKMSYRRRLHEGVRASDSRNQPVCGQADRHIQEHYPQPRVVLRQLRIQ